MLIFHLVPEPDMVKLVLFISRVALWRTSSAVTLTKNVILVLAVLFGGLIMVMFGGVVSSDCIAASMFILEKNKPLPPVSSICFPVSFKTFCISAGVAFLFSVSLMY